MADVAYDPYCNRWAHEIPDIAQTAEMIGFEGLMGAHEYVLEEEGTLNPENNHFACDRCYIMLGMPSLPWRMGRWVAE